MAPDNREHHPDEAQRCRTERRPSIVTVEYEDRDRVGDLISYQNGRKDCALIAGKIGTRCAACGLLTAWGFAGSAGMQGHAMMRWRRHLRER